jgi:hypothetical protein
VLSRGFVLPATLLRAFLTTVLASGLLLGGFWTARAQQPELGGLLPPPAPKASAEPTPGRLTTPPRAELPAQVVNGLLVVEAEVDGRRGSFFLDSGHRGCY